MIWTGFRHVEDSDTDSVTCKLNEKFWIQIQLRANWTKNFGYRFSYVQLNEKFLIQIQLRATWTKNFRYRFSYVQTEREISDTDSVMCKLNEKFRIQIQLRTNWTKKFGYVHIQLWVNCTFYVTVVRSCLKTVFLKII
jgi:hypothetical protein